MYTLQRIQSRVKQRAARLNWIGKSAVVEHHKLEFENSLKEVVSSPDGRWLGIGRGSIFSYSAVDIYPIRVEELIAEACARLPRNLSLAEWRQYIRLDVPYQHTCDPMIYPNITTPEEIQTLPAD